MNIIETNLQFKAMDTRKTTNRIILHHAEASKCTAEDIHRWHLGNGWSGAGYHFLVRKDGTVYRLRPEDKVGAHARGSNSDSIGICFEGKYQEETMPEAQIKAGEELVAYLKQKYNITKVQKHSDVCNTSCPGKNFPFNEIANGQVVNSNQTAVTKDTTVLEWQKMMNRVYNCGLAEDNCFGPDCKAKANKYCLYQRKPIINNDHVKFIQNRLCKHGFNVAVDSKFGPDCKAKTIAFQKAKGLKQDGKIGADTTKELLK